MPGRRALSLQGEDAPAAVAPTSLPAISTMQSLGSGSTDSQDRRRLMSCAGVASLIADSIYSFGRRTVPSDILTRGRVKYIACRVAPALLVVAVVIAVGVAVVTRGSGSTSSDNAAQMTSGGGAPGKVRRYVTGTYDAGLPYRLSMCNEPLNAVPRWTHRPSLRSFLRRLTATCV